jgi:hypothetical protein
MSTRDETEVKLAKPVSDGYMVVSIGRGIKQPAHPEGYFSVTADIYSSKRAFDLGSTNAIHSSGQQHERVLEAFPELAPIIALHMADVETGEPMHALANGWYFYRASREDFPRGEYEPTVSDHSLDERGLPHTDEGRRRYCYLSACRTLRIDEIPAVDGKEAFSAFVDEQRERWAQEAAEANRLIDELASRSVAVPADEAEEHEVTRWDHVFDGDLRVSASLLESPGRREGIGSFYRYSVRVSAPRDDGGKAATYTAEYGGSVADYDENRIDAREAALHTLGELTEFLDETAEGMAEGMGIDLLEPSASERESLAAMRRAQRFVDKVSRAIEANREVFA